VDTAALLRAADAALFEAKAQGRNRVVAASSLKPGARPSLGLPAAAAAPAGKLA
jgi:hypothetical protein